MNINDEIVIRKLESNEHGKTRELYEIAFPEDDREFVDYYYEEIASQNEIFAAFDGERIVSMIHVNFYELRIGRQQRKIPYLVAVATHPAYRHRGLMRRVLKTSLDFLRKQKIPFAFLMPASEAIYTPFDFRYISCQRRTEIEVKDYLKKESLDCHRASKADIPDLVWFSGRYLEKCQGTYANRTEQYYERLLKEQQAQNGDVAVLSREGMICGWFYTAEEEEGPTVREAVTNMEEEAYLLPTIAKCFRYDRKVKLYSVPKGIEGKEQPLMMGRILDVSSYGELVQEQMKEGSSFFIKDEFLSENQGSYRFTGKKLEKCSESSSFLGYSIWEFMEKFPLPGPVFLNEVV